MATRRRMPPPEVLDGAEVVLRAWSAPSPFFVMPCSDGSEGIPIHGLAVCRYEKNGAVYRFSCDAAWEVQNDAPHSSVDSARTAPHGQYDVERVVWRRTGGHAGG